MPAASPRSGARSSDRPASRPLKRANRNGQKVLGLLLMLFSVTMLPPVRWWR
jgi:hypothetical protein